MARLGLTATPRGASSTIPDKGETTVPVDEATRKTSIPGKVEPAGPRRAGEWRAMEKVNSIWQWLDGKKSAIGAYCFGAAYAIGKLATIWSLNYPWIGPLADTLTEAGAIFTGVGVIHKGVKAATPEGA